MATTAPESPSLNFKAKSGFITKRAIFRDEVEEEAPVEEEVVEEEPVEEEPVEEEIWEEEPLEGEEFWEEEPTVEEEWVEEEAPVEEEVIEEEAPPPPAPVEQPRVERREPTVIVQPADTGGRTGSALPTPGEMAAYANPDDRGRAILRHFEEEDRRMAEQRTTEVESRPQEDSIFKFDVHPPSGGMKWVLLIAVLTVLGYTVVRQLATDPLKPRMTEKQRQKLMAEVKATTAQATTSNVSNVKTKAAALKTANAKSTKATTANESDELKKLMEERPAMARALKEVQAAYSAEEPKPKSKPPRVEPKIEVSKDGRKHIEIRI